MAEIPEIPTSTDPLAPSDPLAWADPEAPSPTTPAGSPGEEVVKAASEDEVAASAPSLASVATTEPTSPEALDSQAPQASSAAPEPQAVSPAAPPIPEPPANPVPADTSPLPSSPAAVSSAWSAALTPAEPAAPPAPFTPPAAAPAPAAAAPASAAAAPAAEPAGIATSLSVPALEAESGGEGGEWDLLVGKVRAWLEEADLPARWDNLGGPLRSLGLLLAAVVLLRLYGALLDTLGDLPLLPRLLQLVGLITLLRFCLTRLVRSSDRAEILRIWRDNWNDFRGRA